MMVHLYGDFTSYQESSPKKKKRKTECLLGNSTFCMNKNVEPNLFHYYEVISFAIFGGQYSDVRFADPGRVRSDLPVVNATKVDSLIAPVSFLHDPSLIPSTRTLTVSDFKMSLPPLPAGWDRDRVYSASENDQAELSAADQELISAWRNADTELTMAKLRATVAANNDSVNASRVAAGLPTLEAADRAIAEEMGLEDLNMATQKDLLDVAKSMHSMEAEAWGFVVFKTWGYKEQERERWDMFWHRWNEVMDRRLRDMGAVGDLREGLTGKLLWWLVDHETMDGKRFDEVRDCFAELVEDAEDHIPLGIDLDLCLMIDKESVDSLLNRGGVSSALQSPDEEKSFVWGVDVNYDGENDEGEGRDENDPYPGHFKISTSVLIPELWHTLNAGTPDMLYPGKDHIYGGIVGNYAKAVDG